MGWQNWGYTVYRLYLKNWKGNYSRAVDEQKIRRTKKKKVVNKILGYETKTSGAANLRSTLGSRPFAMPLHTSLSLA